MQTTQAITAPRAARTEIGALGVAGMAALMLLVAVLFVAYRAAVPSDGSAAGYVTTGWTADGLAVASSRAGSPLRAGDVVTAVNGVPLATWLGGARGLPHPLLRAGSVVSYTVLREGATLSLQVPLVGYPLGEVLVANWGTLLWLGLMVLVAAYLFVRRPAEAATRVLLVLSTAIAGSTIPWMLSIGPADLVAGPAGPVLYLAAAYLLYAVFWAALLHFALVFPRPFAVGVAQRRLVLAAYLGLIGAQAAWIAGTFPGAPNVLAWIGSWSASQLLLMPAVLVVAAGLGYRQWRSAAEDERLRLRSVIAATSISAALSLIGWYLPSALAGEPILPWSAVGVAGLPFPLALALTVRRGQLFGIETILHRSLVYGALTAGVILAYGTCFVLLSSVVPGNGLYGVTLLAAGAAALVALPLRDVLQRAVSRMLYGDRDEPQRAISRLAGRLETSLDPEAVLPMVAETVAGALRLPYAAIELRRDGEPVAAAAHGLPVGEVERLPLTHRGDEVGWLAFARRGPDEDFSVADRALLVELARQAGAAAYAVRLTRDLQRSRLDLVSAREEERRRLRRDLHDGLGPTLAGTLLKLEAARGRRPGELEPILDSLAADTRRAIEDVRRLAYELRPPVLDQLGLVGALRQEASGLSAGDLSVAVEAPEPMADLAAAVEVAAYRIGSEALANVARHAGAAHAWVVLRPTRDALEIRIEDDGHGIRGTPHAGVGLSSMRERAEELGGELRVERSPHGGLAIAARLPHPEAARRAPDA
jgi:signal transduction histidine kinase